MRTREEQVADIEEFCRNLGISNDTPDAEIIKEWLEEAEQRVRAEIGRDSERLDWLSKGGRGLDSYTGIGTYVTTEGGEIFVNEDIRVAIDAARKVG